MTTVAEDLPVDMGTAQVPQAPLEYFKHMLAQPVEGVPLTKYAQWFAKQCKVSVMYVEKHPKFWDSAYMQMFLDQENLGANDMQQFLKKLQGMAANVTPKKDSDSDDDDMPELVPEKDSYSK
jgi:hypothetical protein